MIAGLLLVAYVVRRISVEEYGLLILAIAFCSLMYLLDLGLGSLLVQAYVSVGQDNPKKLSTLMSTSFVTLAGMGLVAASLVIFLALSLPGPFHIPSGLVPHAIRVFILIALATMIGLPTTAVEHMYQAYHRFDRLNQIQAGLAFLRVIVTVALLANGYGVVGLAALHLVLLTLRLLALLGGLRWSVAGARFISHFDWNVLRPWLRLGGWSALDGIARQIASAADSFILGVFGPVSSVAIFGIGGKLPNHLSSLVTRGAIVVLPSLTEHHVNRNQSELRRLFLNAQKIVFTGALPVVVLGSLCARPFIVLWAGESYASAAAVMRWLLVAALSLAMEYSSDLLLYACGEVKTAAVIATVESVANIALSVLLVLRYGAVGLAAGTAITHLLINAGWYTPKACKTAGVRYWEFVCSILVEQSWIIGALAVASTGLMLIRPWLSPAIFLGMGVTIGIAYLALWVRVTVRPLWKNRDGGWIE